ncbi:MAG TPA: hypothetical protein VKD91_19360 [Pyrinomonadaceae bacterium]|nr:hypothetical protein [Pyrinomonadaceae bacterium]
MSDLKDLYGHMEWADALVWRAVLASPSAVNDEKLRGYFYHLHLVQHAWLRAWQSEAPEMSFPQFDDARAVLLWGRSYYEEVSGHWERLTEARSAETMRLPWADIVEKELGTKPEPISVGETMLQIPLHSQYHRGQINARLRAVGGEPARVDYIVWVWLGRPTADWRFIEQS